MQNILCFHSFLLLEKSEKKIRDVHFVLDNDVDEMRANMRSEADSKVGLSTDPKNLT